MRASSPSLAVSARAIPVPSTISVIAQKFLAAAVLRTEKIDWTQETIATTNRHLAERCAALPRLFPAEITPRRLSKATLYEITSNTAAKIDQARAVLYVHGGAYLVGGGLLAAHMALPVAAMAACRVYSIDYRMPPQHQIGRASCRERVLELV